MLECGIGMGGYVGGMDDNYGEDMGEDDCHLDFCGTCTEKKFKIRQKTFCKDSHRATKCKHLVGQIKEPDDECTE